LYRLWDVVVDGGCFEFVDDLLCRMGVGIGENEVESVCGSKRKEDT
jgi:hypothetical protein